MNPDEVLDRIQFANTTSSAKREHAFSISYSMGDSGTCLCPHRFNVVGFGMSE